MNTAVIGISPSLIKLIGESGTVIQDAGIPEAGRILGRPRGTAMKAGNPNPFHLIPHFNAQVSR